MHSHLVLFALFAVCEPWGGDVELHCFHPWHAVPIHSVYYKDNDDRFFLIYVLAFAMASSFADQHAMGNVR